MGTASVAPVDCIKEVARSSESDRYPQILPTLRNKVFVLSYCPTLVVVYIWTPVAHFLLWMSLKRQTPNNFRLKDRWWPHSRLMSCSDAGLPQWYIFMSLLVWGRVIFSYFTYVKHLGSQLLFKIVSILFFFFLFFYIIHKYIIYVRGSVH